MAQYVTKIRTNVGDIPIDYNALANLPDLSIYATKKSVADVNTLITNVQNEIKNEINILDDTSIKSVANIKPDSNGNVAITPSNIGAATSDHGHSITSLSDTLSVEKGGTGATSASSARSNLGITPANIGAVTMKTATVSLPVGSWSSKKQTVSVSGVTSSNNVIVTAAPASYEHYNECAVRCSAQGSGTLTFTCTDTPTSSLTANVLILT